MMNPQTINVGNRGTRPVCKYSMNTGNKISRDANIRKLLIHEKNTKGL